MSEKILVVDDEESIRWVLSTSLEKEGFTVEVGEDGSEGLKKALNTDYSLILLDINMPDISGLEVLDKLKSSNVETPVILITAQNTVSNAITGIKQGAYDYIAKPFDLDDVNKIVSKAIENRKQSRKVRKKKGAAVSEDELNLGVIVGKSDEMLKIYKTVGRIADKDVTVLLTGESGTGKELITKAIHTNSYRRNNNLVSVNISAIPKELIESELFGHEKGAFTGAHSSKIGRFEEANHGTLHIDEIGEMSADLQSKLLRVLEENKLYRLGSETPIEVDVRIVASTNKDLKSEIKNGKFREDLYYRLNAITINLPPLRLRKDDIPILVEHFIKKYTDLYNLGNKIISDEVIEKFTEYPWPGNVRELENTIKRIILLAPDDIINIGHLNDEAKHIISKSEETDNEDLLINNILNHYVSDFDGSSNKIYQEVINKIEHQLFRIILDKTNGNKKKAAALLGINRNTLAKKLTELGLD
ncbi:MAG: sigma-54-dependent transcriptional regulator [Thermodesulfobacteriota bacterium]